MSFETKNTRRKPIAALLALAAAALLACGGAGTAPNPTSDGGDVDGGIDLRPADVSVPETRVDFGLVDCGAREGVERVVKITNAGGSTVSWTAELESPGFSIVGATSGTFTGGGSVNVRLQADPFPTTVEANTTNRATLVIVIDKQKIFRVPLQATSQGATLSILPGEAVFGEVPMNTQAPDLPLTIKNTGNKAAIVSFDQPPAVDFKVGWTSSPTEVKLEPGASVPGAIGRFRPTKLALQTTTAPITVKGAVCGQSAKAVTMSGKGTGGVVGISPGQLDFGRVNCGAKANFQVFTLLNSGTLAFAWTAALGQGASSYFDISPAAGTVLAGSQAQIFVTPKDIPSTSALTANLYGDVLTITTDAANDTPHDVGLLMSARGAILAFTTAPAGYGEKILFSAPTSQNAVLTNSGNAPATVTLSKTTPSFTIATPNATINGPGSLTTGVTFSPADFGDIADTLSVSTGSVLCQPLPAAVPLTGRGKGAATAVSVGGTRIRVSDGSREETASACAILTGGHVACWGDNQFGQLGVGNTTSSGTPVVIPNFANVTALASSGDSHCSRNTAGQVHCWGANFSGQLGTAGAARTSPTLVAGISNAIAVGAGYQHACAVVAAAAGGTSGKVYCWGKQSIGALGNGVSGTQNAGVSTPVEVTGITDATSVTVASFGGCARRATGAVQCWGYNPRGQLGNGTSNFNANLAQNVLNVTNATALASGNARGRRDAGVLALQSTGTIACWGGGSRRALCGPITTTYPSTTSTPNTVQNVTGATAVSRGARHGCAVIAPNGNVKCFGRNEAGQLGNGATGGFTLAVDVTGLTGATQISSGGDATCVVRAGGSISCWGSNTFGQLGNPAATGTTPSVVFGF